MWRGCDWFGAVVVVGVSSRAEARLRAWQVAIDRPEGGDLVGLREYLRACGDDLRQIERLRPTALSEDAEVSVAELASEALWTRVACIAARSLRMIEEYVWMAEGPESGNGEAV